MLAECEILNPLLLTLITNRSLSMACSEFRYIVIATHSADGWVQFT